MKRSESDNEVISNQETARQHQEANQQERHRGSQQLLQITHADAGVIFVSPGTPTQQEATARHLFQIAV